MQSSVKQDIKPKMLTVRVYGKHLPHHKAQNRRIEFKIQENSLWLT